MKQMMIKMTTPNPATQPQVTKKLHNLLYGTLLFIIFVISFALTAGTVKADDENPDSGDVGIDEKLGDTVPLNDISFFDEYGKPVTLNQVVDGKPTVISIVYYRCPGLCSPLLTGLADVVDLVDLEPGEDFNVLTISMDHTEDYIMANEKKKNYFNTMERKMSESSWRFLTSDSVNAYKITDALGWKFQKQGNDFMHGAALMVISPKGKLVRYLYGTDYLPFDFKMAVTEASEGKVGTTIAKIMQICFSYDPEGRKYVLDITRVSGGIILFLLFIFATVFLVKKKKKDSKTITEDIKENG